MTTKEQSKKYRETHQDYIKQYRLQNRDKLLLQGRNAMRKLKYGLEHELYLQMVDQQKNQCAICGKEETVRSSGGHIRPLSVDHCHVSGQIRGLLCNRCNTMIGYADDNQDLLKSAIEYLQKWQ